MSVRKALRDLWESCEVLAVATLTLGVALYLAGYCRVRGHHWRVCHMLTGDGRDVLDRIGPNTYMGKECWRCGTKGW